ncbi:MAG TPA: TonB family protein [Gemmatimonadota bacterium]|nr:TonB family protein [Gemmatimonadota bacterium]
MIGPHGTTRLLVALALFALVTPATAPAQEGGPLLKSDLVRMMTASNYTATEMAAIVRMNCVGFEPTARDRSQLGNLPNADLVLAEVDRCISRPNSPRTSRRAADATEASESAEKKFRAPPPPARRKIQLAGVDLAANTQIAPQIERPAGSATQIDPPSSSEDGDVETPPSLLNWKEVSSAFLREYRPNVRQPGTVLLWLRVGPDGRVIESRVKHSTGDPVMADAAQRITDVMEFQPATRRDRPVESWTELPINYSSK